MGFFTKIFSSFSNTRNNIRNTFNNVFNVDFLSDDDYMKIEECLLSADISWDVTEKIIEKKAVGEKLIKSTTPSQTIIKIVNDELVKILGSKNEELKLNAVPPASILLVGLQGSGKTTSAAKLAKILEKNKKKKVMLVSLDVYRPAAQEQLRLVAESNGIQFLPIVESQQPIDITKRALNAANLNGSDVIIFDTAGRTQIDLPMMSEIKQIKDITKPAETILVADSLTGQIAVNIACSLS